MTPEQRAAVAAKPVTPPTRGAGPDSKEQADAAKRRAALVLQQAKDVQAAADANKPVDYAVIDAALVQLPELIKKVEALWAWAEDWSWEKATESKPKRGPGRPPKE